MKPRRGPKPGSPAGGTDSTGLVLGRVLGLAISCANPPPVTEPVWSVGLADLGVILACLAVVEQGLDRLLEVVQLVLPGPVSSLRGWS